MIYFHCSFLRQHETMKLKAFPCLSVSSLLPFWSLELTIFVSGPFHSLKYLSSTKLPDSRLGKTRNSRFDLDFGLGKTWQVQNYKEIHLQKYKEITRYSSLWSFWSSETNYRGFCLFSLFEVFIYLSGLESGKNLNFVFD